MEEIQSILKSIDCEHLISVFEEQEIDRETALSLEDQELKELFPKIGPRIKFKKALANLKAKYSDIPILYADDFAISMPSPALTEDVDIISTSSVPKVDDLTPEEDHVPNQENLQREYISISLIALSKAKSDEEAFAELVPSIFDAPPTSVASVIYPDGSSANLGNKLEYDTILPQPVIFWDADPEVFYTLVIIDVDAPKPPGATAFIHFAINNIIGTDLETGYTIYPYFPTIPAPGTGPHRYVQLVYQQDSKIENKRVDTALNNVEDGDRATNYKKFLERYELKLIAWNFFTAGTTLSVYSF